MEEDTLESGAAGKLALDTRLEVERVQVARWREMSALEKVRLVADASTSIRDLSLAGIRLRHPHASEEECRLRYAWITLGRSLAGDAYADTEALVDR
jgi:hypothetical protein